MSGSRESKLHVLLLSTGVTALLVVHMMFRKPQTNHLPPMANNKGLLATIRGFTGGNMGDFLISQFQHYGGIFRLPFPFVRAIVVANTLDARTIYGENHGKPSIMYKAIDSLTSGPSILSIVGGDNWYHRRKAINTAFALSQVQRMNEVALAKVEAWISHKLMPLAKLNESFDVGKEMILLTISVICQAGFDYNIPLSEAITIRRAIQIGVEEFTIKSMVNPFRQFATTFLPDRREAFEASHTLHKFAKKLLDLYRDDSTQNTPDTVLDRIMTNLNYASDSERIADIIMMLFAGHDTTGYTLAFALLELAKNPEEQRELRQEESSKESNTVTYVQAVIHETMRLHPAAPFSAIKQLNSDVLSNDGYRLPKGSIVFIAQIALSHDATIFPDPFAFRPSRWLVADSEAKQALFPFSLGKRNCVGQRLANAQLRSLLPRLVRQFDFSVENEGTKVTQGTIELHNCLLRATPM